jgi:hypothetical protein
MKKIIFKIVFFLSSGLFAQSPNFMLFDHTNAPFVNDSITWVEIDTNNVKWVGTRNGLYSFQNNAWTVYNTSNSNIPDNRVDKFKIAYDNTIWFVNNNKGFYKFKNNTFTLYNQNNLPGLITDSLAGLTLDSTDVFFWTDYNGVIKFNSLNNTLHTFNTSNSYISQVEKLVTHGNHQIYGLAKNINSVMLPQNFADSVQNLNDFVISNTSGLPINYCFLDLFRYCNYFSLNADRYGNRYEVVQIYTGSQTVDERLRTYDKNNTLFSEINFNQWPYIQMAKNSYGAYRLYLNGVNGLEINIPPNFSASYNKWNSIIPSPKIINFDIDTLHNVWMATPKGLVAYNNMGVITDNPEMEINDFLVSPNPANDIVLITDKQGITNVELHNITGQLLLSETVSTSAHELYLQNFAEGIYFIKVTHSNGMSSVKKLLINN